MGIKVILHSSIENVWVVHVSIVDFQYQYINPSLLTEVVIKKQVHMVKETFVQYVD